MDILTGGCNCLRDFTEKKEKQEQIEYLSFHDHLTGLYNRRYFDEELKTVEHPTKPTLIFAYF